MHTKITFIFLLLFFCIFPLSAHPDFEPLFSVQDFLQSDSNTKSYSADDVFTTGLLYSECQPSSEVWKRCQNEFGKIKATAKSEEIQALSESQRGRAILKYLYRDYLKKYDFNQTKLDVALESGTYNCVSSAILYMAAAKAAGLEVYGQRTTQHAFCSIYVPSEKNGKSTKIDVETTNPYGFNPGSKEEIENENQIKKYYVVPKKYYSNRQQTSDAVFTGLIAGNLCSDYIKAGNYEKALPLGAARYQAVSEENSVTSKQVRNEFDILACNYINIIPKSAAEYSDILDWFTQFINRWGSNEFIQKNMDAGFNNLLVLCVNEKNYPLAEKASNRLENYLSKKQFAKGQESLADIFVLAETDGQTSDEKIESISNIKSSQQFSDSQLKRIDLHLESAWLEILNAYMKSRDYSIGYEKSLAALQDLPQSANIKKMNQAFYSNCIAQIHNNFAREANRQNFEEAVKILEEGLKEFPDDKTLKRDLADLKI